MSSRIEKGGARFKPSIVPRRPAGGAPAASGATATSSTTPQSQSQQQPPPSPSLAPQVSARQARPPSVRNKGPAAATSAIAASTGTTQSLATPATPSSTSQSYAFNVSPSVISKPGASATPRTSISAGQPSASTSKSKPVFRRPSVSKPRPGSRTSLTPAPHFAQPSASLPTSTSSLHLIPLFESDDIAQAGADAEHISTRTDAPPSIGGTRSSRNASIVATRGTVQTEPVIEKASQPDPVQAPQLSTRPRGSSTLQSNVTAAVKQSASQKQTQSDVRPHRRAAPDSGVTPASSVDKDVQASSTTSSKKDKGRETLETETASPSVKAGSQATEAVAQETELEKAQRASQRRINAAARLQKRRLKRKELDSGKPRRPLSAYLLFVNSVRTERQAQNPDMPLTELTAEMAAEWRELPPAQRTKWEAEAALLRQHYDTALDAWKVAYPEGVALGPEDESDMETTSEIGDDGQPVRRKKRRITASRRPHTVSDDEEEYRKQLYHEGEQLTASRIDPTNVTMADLSTTEYKKGRAGPRTFEAERVYKRLVHDRRAAAKSAVLGEHVLGEKVNHASPSPAPAANIIRTTNGVPVATGAEERLDGEEEVVGDQTGDDDDGAETSEVEESAPETDADGTTDGEGGAMSSRRASRKREASVAGTEVSFRENRFAVQTRIVDGKIVLDETSLFANYGNGEDDRDNMEVIDEREGDRFVNAATYSRKLGRNRKWSADETAKFYRSLQQWGTDFEMIARLFPGRDRVMIKKKFNVEEKSNPKLVDEALKNSVPVNLEAYALAIGVDLSGPPPEIKADLQDIEALAAATASAAGTDTAVKKREGTAPLSGRKGGERSDAEPVAGDDDGYEYEEVVEVDDDGNEQVIRRRLGKKPGSKGGKKRRNSTRKNSTSTPAPPPPLPPQDSVGVEAATSAVDATEAEPPASSGSKAKTGRAGLPPAIVSRKSTRATRKRAASINNSSKEAPGDGMEVEEIIGEL